MTMPMLNPRVYRHQLKKGRRAAERVMLDHCRIERQGTKHFNDATGTYVAEAPTVIYDGPCRIKAMGPGTVYGATPAVAESSRTKYDLRLPWSRTDAGDVAYGDYVTMASGRRYYVDSVEDSEGRTARHAYVMDVDRIGEQ